MKRVDLAFTAVLVPADFFAVLSGALTAYFLRFSDVAVAWRPIQFILPFSEFFEIALWSAGVFVVTFAFAGLYRTQAVSLGKEVGRVGMASLSALGILLAISFFVREFFDSRFIFLASAALAVLFVVAGRITIRLIQRLLRHMGVDTFATVVIGRSKSADEVREWLEEHPGHGIRPIKVIARFNEEQEEKLRRWAREGKIDALFIADATLPKEDVLRAKTFADIEHLRFFYCADLFPGASLDPLLHTLADRTVIEVRRTPLDGWGAIYKRGFDLFFGTLLLLLTIPVQLLVALAIVLDSRGGVFFSRLPGGEKTLRIGQGGKPFHYFKFRSMQKDRHFERYTSLKAHNTRKGPLVKTGNDPRITRVGKVIRATSLDELPELWLVVLGHMSLVGPRPHLPEEVERYALEDRRVFTIKPGMTGLAQVSGRASLDFTHEVALDMHYIAHWSPWLDFFILLKTPFAVLSRRGAS